MNKWEKLFWIGLFLLGCLAMGIVRYYEHQEEPIAVTRQSGFVIDVDNELMILACKYHNIGSDDIRWDTVNDNFVFYRDGDKCHVFTNGFKKYLEENDEN